MNPNRNHLTPPQPTTGAALESRIDQAIERKPELQIPADFAARVATRALARPLRRRRYKAQFGPMIALLLAPLSALVLFALAPHASPTFKSLSFDAEVVLVAELGFIGWWIARIFNIQKSR